MIKYYLKNEAYDLRLATDGASGYDLQADLSNTKTIHPGERVRVSTGLHLEIPKGCEGQIRTRSGLCLHHGIIVANAPGTVDSDYRGECGVTLLNIGKQPHQVLPGDRVAQIVFCPVFVPQYSTMWKNPVTGVEECIIVMTPTTAIGKGLVRVSSLGELSDTARGVGGHGSTGR